MTVNSLGGLAGLGSGLGVLALWSWARARRPRRLADRIAPYVGGAALGRRPDGSDPWTTLQELMRRAPEEGADRDLSLRLLRAGLPSTADRYRLERLTWAALGSCVGAGVGWAIAIGGTTMSVIALLAGVGTLGGWLLRDLVLGRQIRRRRREIERQLPVLAELLALGVASGAGPVAALDRAAATMTGALPNEIAVTADDIRGGRPLDGSLRAMAERTGVGSVRRFVEGIVIASERGTPLAEVVRAQAADARSHERRLLMESAGRKDVAMLVPIVFVVLPTVVLVALFPGAHALHLAVP
jgi:tight adherence protein C